MIDAKNVVLDNGLNVNDFIGNLSLTNEIARQGGIKFFQLSYGNATFARDVDWVNPASVNIATYGNVSDNDAIKIVTLTGQQAIKLSRNYRYFMITTFNFGFLDSNTKLGIQMGLDYWENGVKHATPYDTHVYVVEGTILGTTRAYANRIVDIRTVTPSDSINEYLPSFNATATPKPDYVQNINQYVFAINSNLR